LQIFEAEIAAVVAATPQIRVLSLAIPDTSFRFLPGQWVDLSVDIDGAVHTSGYSITTSPAHAGMIELAIKASTRHPLARWVHGGAAVGDRVRVSQGQGPFVYLPEMSDNVVLIGGGVGITRCSRSFATCATPISRRRRIWSIACRTAGKYCSVTNSKQRSAPIATCT
jgi:ferredoxin-NADP reductase